MDAITTAAPPHSLRERMLQDMTMRGFGAHTQKDYIRHVRSFAAFLGRPPDTATMEDLRRYQVDQHERAVGPATINGAVSALRFLFGMPCALRPSRAKVDETCLVRVEREPVPSKTLAQHRQDPVGIDDVVERHNRVVSVAGKGTFPAQPWPNLRLEPFIQHMMQEDV